MLEKGQKADLPYNWRDCCLCLISLLHLTIIVKKASDSVLLPIDGKTQIAWPQYNCRSNLRSLQDHNETLREVALYSGHGEGVSKNYL